MSLKLENHIENQWKDGKDSLRENLTLMESAFPQINSRKN
jgi:hypothetical protein